MALWSVPPPVSRASTMPPAEIHPSRRRPCPNQAATPARNRPIPVAGGSLMNVRRIGRAPTWVALAALTVAGLVSLPPTAHAAGPVLPGNEGDVGVYTNGQSHVMDI